MDDNDGFRRTIILLVTLTIISITEGFTFQERRNIFVTKPSYSFSRQEPELICSNRRKISRCALNAARNSNPSGPTTTAAPPAISIENLSCSHNGGETWQLKDVSYVLPRYVKAVLVGRNGTGKSTLLRILAENTCRNDGFVDLKEEGVRYDGAVTAPRDLRVAFVEQEPPMSSDILVGDALLGIRDLEQLGGRQPQQNTATASVFEIVRHYRRAVINAASDPDEFTAASAAMNARDGWAVLTKADEVATKLRVQHLHEQPLSKLSGGERKRVALAAALVQEPDVLLLDEPTNFLSLAGVQWLSDLLQENRKLTCLVVTHDRAFLDEVCDMILELDNGSLYSHQGDYSSYLEGKAERLALEDAAVQSAKAKYRVELDWMRRQPQARESKSKARIDAFYKLEKATKPRPPDPKLGLDAGDQRRIGTKICTMRNVSLKFGDRVMLDDFNYDFCGGDRICLAGYNGVGKTTFIRVLTGQQPCDSGTIEIGETVVLGVYDQLGLQLDGDPTVLDFVLEQVQSRDNAGMSEAPDEARKLLKKFEFQRQRWNERVSMLSGGERRRLQMLSVLSMRPNFLLMDEPSVDCDLDTLSALESYLNEFTGVLIIVSHDRAFADKVTDHLFVFEGDGQIKDFQGTLSEYASCLVELENDKIQSQTSGETSTTDKKASYAEDRAKRNESRNAIRKAKREMSNIENAMEKLRVEADAIQKEIDGSSPDEGWSVLAELTDKVNQIEEQIEQKETRWIELAEELEALEGIEV